MEIAHRLSLAPSRSKCFAIHGHGMQVELEFLVEQGADGMAINAANQPMEFGAMKQMFRNHIDDRYDHHLVLNESDPWARELILWNPESLDDLNRPAAILPGLVTVPGDPTTENLAKWIAEWACANYRCDVVCNVEETATNGASAKFHWNSFGASMMKGAL